MTGVELLQAAIEKLEALLRTCTPGEWVEIGGDLVAESEGHVVDPRQIGFLYSPVDDDLVVTMRRMVGPSLRTLRKVRTALACEVIREEEAADALELADAILGGAR
jgi:hypothetical protein